jgi:DcmR-like sensory protein
LPGDRRALRAGAGSGRPADGYADAITSFLEEGLAAGEPALAALPCDSLELIRARLGSAGEMVVFQDMSVLGRNPSRIIPVIRDFTDAHPGDRTRFVGEPIWAGRSPAEIQEATRHEALINAAFADMPTSILCPYRSDGLDQAVLDDAEVTHPHLLGRDRTRVSPRYAGAAADQQRREDRLDPVVGQGGRAPLTPS